ncbi:MAG TPA: hypothetical protein VMI75_32595 [Polyangiaceae bacterium]|nr:hypothetical protein [Polyangiaceae bacterium]
MTTVTARHALVTATLVFAACTPQAPATRSAMATAAPSSRAPPPAAPAPTFASWDGLYVITDTDAGGRSTAWVRTLTTGVSLAFGPFVVTASGVPGPAGLRTTITDDGGTHALTLAPPAQAGAPWRLVFDGASIGFELHVGELEARVREHLIEGQRFTRIDQSKLAATGPIDAAKTNDVLVVLPRGLVRVELPDSPRAAPCFVDALVPMTTDAGAPFASPLPAAGALGVVRYAMPKVTGNCADVDPDAQAHGNDGGAFFFATRDGRVPGLLMAGYMYAELFVAPDCTRGDLATMTRAAQEALERQAE